MSCRLRTYVMSATLYLSLLITAVQDRRSHRAGPLVPVQEVQRVLCTACQGKSRLCVCVCVCVVWCVVCVVCCVCVVCVCCISVSV